MRRPKNKGRVLEQRIRRLLVEKGAAAIYHMNEKEWDWFRTRHPIGQRIDARRAAEAEAA